MAELPFTEVTIICTMVDHRCCIAVNASCAFHTKLCRRNTV